MNKFTVPAIIMLLVLLVAGLGYFIFQNQLKIKDLSDKSQAQTQTSNPSSQKEATSTPPVNQGLTKQQVQSSIETLVNSKNYQALIPLMVAPLVNFSLMSSGCCDPMAPQEAAQQMSYIDEGLPLNFDQNSQIVTNIKSKKPEYKDAYIGVSTSGEHTAIFVLDSQNKIQEIQLAVSYTLYDF